MKILYAIQGTGNGHISRAREIIPHLEQYGQLDLLISGTEADMSLSQPLKWQLHGLSFVFGKRGGVDRWETLRIMDLKALRADMKMLPLEKYDLIINDYEPVTARACKKRGIPCIALSHQSSFLSPKTPRPKRILPHWHELLLKYYAPSTKAVSFHFQSYDSFIHTPVIRKEIRQLSTRNDGHYTVYLPAHDDDLLLHCLQKVDEVNWQVFSKHAVKASETKNVSIKPVNNFEFNKSLASCEGLLTAGGFESPAEALFLKKKVFSIPMMGQWEQQCNAEAMRLMGIPVIPKITRHFTDQLKEWVRDDKGIDVDYPDKTAEIVKSVVNNQ